MKNTQVERPTQFGSEPTICADIRDGVLEVADMDIDNFTSTALPEVGHHVVRIINWELIPEKEIVNRYAGKVVSTGERTKKYIDLWFKDTANGAHYETRLYPGAVPFFMRSAADQTDGAVMGMTLSQILKYFGTHDLDVWVRWDKNYGAQFDYFDREERRQSKFDI